MMSATPFRREVRVNRLRENPDLLGDKCQQCSRRPFAGAEDAARVAQIAKHQGVAEAIVIAVGAPDCRQVGLRQREVAH
jgi:hypothetical protein